MQTLCAGVAHLVKRANGGPRSLGTFYTIKDGIQEDALQTTFTVLGLSGERHRASTRRRQRNREETWI